MIAQGPDYFSPYLLANHFLPSAFSHVLRCTQQDYTMKIQYVSIYYIIYIIAKNSGLAKASPQKYDNCGHACLITYIHTYITLHKIRLHYIRLDYMRLDYIALH